jgi:hypothetical protein
MAQIVDSYSESNQDTYYVRFETYPRVSQSFTANGGTLNSCEFYLKKVGSPTGNVYAEIYAHTGTYGTSSIRSGSALATSDAVDASTIGETFGLTSFTFSGANKISLSETYYCVGIYYNGGAALNYLYVGADDSTPTHSGNVANYDNEVDLSADLCFYVYKDDVSVGRAVSSGRGVSGARSVSSNRLLSSSRVLV